jgi:cobalamin biosynthesis Mg chelatase CobN
MKSMEPSFISEDFESLDDMDGLEGAEGAVNQRYFTIAMLGLGGILVVAIIFVAIMFLSRTGEKSARELENENIIKTNEAIQAAIVASQTAEVVIATNQKETAVQVAMQQTESAAAKAATGTAAAEATASAQPTETHTPTRTSVIASPTETSPPGGTDTGEGEGTGISEGTTGEPGAVAQVTGTSSPSARTPTPTRRASVPDTGVGGLSVVLFAVALVVVLFAARRLRMVT